MAADDRLTARFFEYASFAFTQPLSAIRVRQYVRLDDRVVTAFRAVIMLCCEAAAHAWHRPRSAQGLQRGTIIRKESLIESYQEMAMLFDDFAIERPYEPTLPSRRSLVVFGVIIIATVLLLLTTPLDVLAYVGLLVTIVVLVVVALSITQHSGYGRPQKAALLSLLPFTPLYYVCQLAYTSARMVARALKVKLLTPRQGRPTQRRQPARTQ